MRSVIDASGRTVQVPATINRVATNYPAMNQMVYMLGAGDKIVATINTIASNQPLFVTMYPRLAEIPAPFGAGTDVNIEQLIATKPDVALLTTGSKALIEPLERVGIPALLMASFGDPDQLKDGVSFLGMLLGPDAAVRADQFRTYYDRNVSLVTTATADISKEQRPRAYYTAGNPLESEGVGSIITMWMEAGGARNVTAEAGLSGGSGSFVATSMEDVIAWDPEFVVVRDASTKRAILADPRWSGISAVKNDRVLVNPRSVFVWSARSAEAALQVLWAGKTFQPERFPDLDMRQETRQFYQTFYGYTLSDEQLDAIFNPTAP